MDTLFFFVLVFWASFCFAKMEIEIEGPRGWADNLPTWRISKDHVLSRLLAGGRELTGYHLWVQTFVFSLLHMVFLFQPFSLSVELRLFAFIFYVWIVEDFLWFILNPAFGLIKFRKENIWWHERHWLWFAPRDYFVFIPFATLLYYISSIL
jgi:hypothetical protein